jgi:hypothetical protein
MRRGELDESKISSRESAPRNGVRFPSWTSAAAEQLFVISRVLKLGKVRVTFFVYETRRRVAAAACK